MTAHDLATAVFWAVIEAVNKLEWSKSSPPCITARRGGCVIKKFREATKADAAGVVFLFVFIRKTTPASPSVDASQCFLNRSATPPCGDARRGRFAPFQFVHSFYDRPTC